MNFEYNKNIKNKIFKYDNINFNKILKSIFADEDYTAYIISDKKIGIINKNTILNNNYKDYINYNHPIIDPTKQSQKEIYNIALENNSFVFPIVNNGKIISEYIIKDKPTSIFSMDLNRWTLLYKNNSKIYNLLTFQKRHKIYITGSFGNTILEYLKKYNKFDCQILDKAFVSFKKALKEKCLIIDTDDGLSELKQKIVSYFKVCNKSNADYITLYNLTNESEALFFKSYIENNNIQTSFFVFPDIDKFTNLNIDEQFRIKFDKHYRFYYNNMNTPQIKSLVKKVFNETYSKKFIKSRDSLSGLIFKDGICCLQDNSNPFCKAFNGKRFTAFKTSYYKNCLSMFGACLVYGATVDDEHTIASYLQKLINDNLKDYEVNNYGARNLSVFESFRIATNLHSNPDDQFIFVIIEEEYEILKKFGFNKFFNFIQMFNKENLHDYFLDEPMHCNHIGMQKCAEYIYDNIQESLKIKSSVNQSNVQKGNKFNQKINEIATRIQEYINYLSQYKVDKEYCSLVLMHANPFTMGHYKLVEYASKHSDHVYVMLALNSGMFEPDDVAEMSTIACKDLKNVTVIRDRTDIIPRELFLPGYFERDDNPNGSGDTMGFIDFIGKVIKPALNIKERFLGSEPIDIFTKKMNEESHKNLPKYGIKSTEIPRFCNKQGIPYSAKTVRNALKRNDWATIENMVPPITAKILKKYKGLV